MPIMRPLSPWWQNGSNGEDQRFCRARSIAIAMGEGAFGTWVRTGRRLRSEPCRPGTGEEDFPGNRCNGRRSLGDSRPDGEEKTRPHRPRAISDLLFITDPIADENLRTEGVAGEKIHFVGNTMIDTLHKSSDPVRWLHRSGIAVKSESIWPTLAALEHGD